MSKFLHHEDDAKTTAIPWVFSENSRAKNYLSAFWLVLYHHLEKWQSLDELEEEEFTYTHMCSSRQKLILLSLSCSSFGICHT